jgi:NTE family protein
LRALMSLRSLLGHPPLGLALQGGGAHGAFTWGVLDALLEQRANPIVAVSGASAGAMNALLLAHGLLEGGRDGARAALSAFWNALGQSVPWDTWGLVTGDGAQLTAPAQWMLRWMQSMSPAQANPMRMNPLRELLARSVDFERLRGQSRIALHIAATHANSGRLRVFHNAELTLDAAMASACLPSLHHAVEIDGEPYWDGGFSANPPLMPLLRTRGTLDVMVLMLSPWRLGDTPTSADAIRERTMEIAFNSAFLGEMRLVAEATELAQHAWWPGTFERRLKRARWHLIDGGEHLAALPASSKLIAHTALLQRLHDAGRERALQWLQGHAQHIGRRGTLDLIGAFGSHRPPAA